MISHLTTHNSICRYKQRRLVILTKRDDFDNTDYKRSARARETRMRAVLTDFLFHHVVSFLHALTYGLWVTSSPEHMSFQQVSTRTRDRQEGTQSFRKGYGCACVFFFLSFHIQSRFRGSRDVGSYSD